MYIYTPVTVQAQRFFFRVSGPASDRISHRRATASRRGLKPARSGLGAVLRSSWAPRGPSWGRLGASLDLLGAILGSCKRFRSEESDVAKSARFPCVSTTGPGRNTSRVARRQVPAADPGYDDRSRATYVPGGTETGPGRHTPGWHGATCGMHTDTKAHAHRRKSRMEEAS